MCVFRMRKCTRSAGQKPWNHHAPSSDGNEDPWVFGSGDPNSSHGCPWFCIRDLGWGPQSGRSDSCFMLFPEIASTHGHFAVVKECLCINLSRNPSGNQVVDMKIWWTPATWQWLPKNQFFVNYVYVYIPGTPNNHLWMDVWWNNHFLYKGLESSN